MNFGIFTENTAENMAVPIRYAVELLRKAGWKTPEEIQKEADSDSHPTSTDSNANTAASGKPQ